MTATFPAAGLFTAPATTNGQGKQAWDDLRDTLYAAAVDFYGPTPPTAVALGLTTLAGIRWHSSTDGHLYKRNQADTAWIDMIAVDESSGTAFWGGGLPKSTTSTRPASLTKSGLWVYAVSSSIWRVYLYSGTADILLGTANPSTGAWTPAGQGDTVIAVTASRTLDVNNALYVVDSSSAAVALTLPLGATAGEPYNVRIKWEAGANAVTYLPSGTDTINHTTGAKSISAVGETVALSVDVDVNPDNWTSVSTVAGMQASNALSEIAALSLQGAARTNIGAAATSDVAAARHGDFVSADQAIVAGSLLTIPHGLGSQPARTQLDMVCVGSELGYAAGAVIQIMPLYAGANHGGQSWADATNLYVRTGSGGIAAMNTAGVIATASVANWRWRARAWR